MSGRSKCEIADEFEQLKTEIQEIRHGEWVFSDVHDGQVVKAILEMRASLRPPLEWVRLQEAMKQEAMNKKSTG